MLGCVVAPNNTGLTPGGVSDPTNASILRSASNIVVTASGLKVATDYLGNVSPSDVGKAMGVMTANSDAMKAAVGMAIDQGAVVVPVSGATGGITTLK